jgi:GNAT superfamily N-acetyltransferase
VESVGPGATIRAYRPSDEDAVVRVWHRAGLAAYTFIPTWQAFALEEARRVFREHISPRCEIWVATLAEVAAAYVALAGTYVDRLYVDPPHWRLGLGSRLIEHAKALRPEGLELHTHQENLAARSFYERHGFVAVRFGVSPAPESVPDVEYHWRPLGGE